MVAVAAVAVSAAGVIAGSDNARHASNTAKDAAADQKATADRQLDMADQQWQRYLKTYGPIEDEFVNESRDFGSNANKEKAAAEAAGDVTSSYAGLRQKLNSTPGLDPSSQKYLDTVSKIGLSEAAQSAAAQTGARTRVDTEGRARLSDAVSLGKGLPGSASQTLGAASNTLGTMSANANANQVRANQGLGGAWSALGSAVSRPTFQKTVGGWFDSPAPMSSTTPALGAPSDGFQTNPQFGP